MNNIFYLITLTITVSIHCSQTNILPTIIDLDRPTYWTLYFADDKEPHLYPPEIIQRLAIIKATKAARFNDYSQVLSLSHIPTITAKKFNTIVALMRRPHQNLYYDKALLAALSTADILLENNDPTRKNLIEQLLKRVLEKDEPDTRTLRELLNEKTERKKFFELFTNRIAQLFVEAVKEKTCQEALAQPSTTNVSYYADRVCAYSIAGLHDGLARLFPVAQPSSEKPVLSFFPLAIKDLVNAHAMPEIKSTKNRQNKTVPEGSLVLAQEHLVSLQGLPALPNLVVLNLQMNRLTNIPAGLFTHFSNLDTLRLGGNNIKTIPPKAWLGLTNLYSLELNNNPLILDAETFTNLPNLQNLDLTFCNLKSIDTNVFRPLERLTHLMLHDNNIRTIHANGLKDLKNLAVVNIAQNPIAYNSPINVTLPLACTLIIKNKPSIFDKYVYR